MKRAASSLACLGLLAPMLSAASITFVGTESDVPDGGYRPVSNWSNPAVAKTRDLNGDDRFGGVGYYQITPGITGIPDYSEDVPDGNDLGLSTSNPTLDLLPHFLMEDPVGSEGTFLNLDYFPQFSDPSGTGLLQQGALWLSSINQQSGTGPGNVAGKRSRALTFTLGKSTSFRLGVAVDTMGDGNYAPDHVSVSNVVTGERFSTTPLLRDGVADMVFFDIGGNIGDSFEVALWQTNDLNIERRMAFSLVTFDQLAVSVTPTLNYTQANGNIILSWQQNIPGWILESSTDLGVADTWDPVPGVSNNTVTVPMAGAPKNFFRLKKSP